MAWSRSEFDLFWIRRVLTRIPNQEWLTNYKGEIEDVPQPTTILEELTKLTNAAERIAVALEKLADK